MSLQTRQSRAVSVVISRALLPPLFPKEHEDAGIISPDGSGFSHRLVFRILEKGVLRPRGLGSPLKIITRSVSFLLGHAQSSLLTHMWVNPRVLGTWPFFAFFCGELGWDVGVWERACLNPRNPCDSGRSPSSPGRVLLTHKTGVWIRGNLGFSFRFDTFVI